jgi:hypothetical protein
MVAATSEEMVALSTTQVSPSSIIKLSVSNIYVYKIERERWRDGLTTTDQRLD